MRQNQISTRLHIYFAILMIIAVTMFLPAINIQAATKSTKSTRKTTAKDLEITLNDKTYIVSKNLKRTDIPKDFSKSKVEYNGNEYEGLKFDEGDINLLYLVEEDDKTAGSFYMVNAQSTTLSPFIKVSGNQSYIILLDSPANAKVPKGYQTTKLTLDGSNTLSVYHYDPSVISDEATKDTKKTTSRNEAASTDKTSNKDEARDLSSDATLNTDMSDFYLVYAINEKGIIGWYQYDKKENTYQRFVDVTSTQATQEEKYQALSQKYDALSDTLKDKNSLIKKAEIAIGFAGLILFFIMINFIIRIAHLKAEIRDMEENGFEEDYEDDYEEVYEDEHTTNQTNVKTKNSKKNAMQKDSMPSEDQILQAMKDEEMELLKLN